MNIKTKKYIFIVLSSLILMLFTASTLMNNADSVGRFFIRYANAKSLKLGQENLQSKINRRQANLQEDGINNQNTNLNRKPKFYDTALKPFSNSYVIISGKIQLTNKSDGISRIKSNSLPVAIAGKNQTTSIYRKIVLDGSKSYDSDKDLLHFKWSIKSKPKGSTSKIKKQRNASTHFIPDMVGKYLVLLEVYDGISGTSFSQLKLSVKKSFNRPIAVIGENQFVKVKKEVNLDGSKSRGISKEIKLDFHWLIISKPKESKLKLINTTNSTLKLKTDIEGTYEIGLVVSQREIRSSIKKVTITATDKGNSKPVAKIVAKKQGIINQTIDLDGSESIDAENDVVTCKWTFVKAPNKEVEISSPESCKTSFTPNIIGEYVVSLIVNDGKTKSDSVPQTISIFESLKDLESKISISGGDQYFSLGQKITLIAKISPEVDTDEIITYTWSLVETTDNANIITDNQNVKSITLNPEKGGTYKLKVQAYSDEIEFKEASTWLIITDDEKQEKKLLDIPVANAGKDQRAYIGTTIKLSGLGSGSSSGETLTYHWTFKSVPSGSTANLANPNKINSTFMPDIEGDYTVSLVVEDSENPIKSLPDEVAIKVYQANIPINPSTHPSIKSIIDSYIYIDYKKIPLNNPSPECYAIDKVSDNEQRIKKIVECSNPLIKISFDNRKTNYFSHPQLKPDKKMYLTMIHCGNKLANPNIYDCFPIFINHEHTIKNDNIN